MALARFIRFKHTRGHAVHRLGGHRRLEFRPLVHRPDGHAGGSTLEPIDPNSVFYGDFTALIFVDVILLITFAYLSDYDHSAEPGFVIATIILRLSFSLEGWSAVAHEVLAALLALSLLLLQAGLGWGHRRLGPEVKPE